ncbi:MAG: hypothetical protein CNC91_02570 [Flavobacteriales bacterium MED-G22]|nr:PepSY domain-containing protein [Flavobacteriaceae bacterium]PDH44330.1 MAG: hypothetical protein CNC91_02570 [Flavobacteriales bacterium MED-G22]|tara:strand:- start:2831 stop:3340 length:510 start_codon:yes stop_codon:yes gene_type:complete
MKKNSNYYFRIFHRYLGFYLVGIMAVYAISGITLIFRKTDAFKDNVEIKAQLERALELPALEKALNIGKLEITKEENNMVYFDGGQYNKQNGEVIYHQMQLPYVLSKMQKLHKATTKSPVYWLNIFFGVSLLFFVISAFWMFLPETAIFKKGVVFSLLGIIMTFIILFI